MNEIWKRISVRKFEDRPVEDEKIEQILRAAMAAPSAANQQPWEFYVVRDPGVIKKLSKASLYARPAAGAPVVIVPCFRQEGLRFKESAEIDLATATENMLLEITSLGLGGVWLGIAPDETRMRKVEEALAIDTEKLRAFALVPVGYPAEEREQQDRFDADRIHYVG